MNAGIALREAAERFGAISDTPRLDAELLMAHALGIAREQLLLAGLDLPEPPGFQDLVKRRLAHEPVAYLTGRRAFWTIELDVGPGALIPRPDSETLIEAALAHFGRKGPAHVLDLGTGPGTLLLAALDQWPGARGLGVDRSEQALAIARSNAERLGLAERAEFRLGDWGRDIEDRFDLVLCNPPYVEEEAALGPGILLWEPHGALFAGPDGLSDYRLLAPQLARLVSPGGIACIEIGDGQEQAVSALLEAEGLHVSPRADLAGKTRCLAAALI